MEGKPMSRRVSFLIAKDGKIAHVTDNRDAQIHLDEMKDAIAKLAINNPYLTSADKLAQYVDLLKYVVLRNTQHHFAGVQLHRIVREIVDCAAVDGIIDHRWLIAHRDEADHAESRARPGRQFADPRRASLPQIWSRRRSRPQPVR